MKTKIMHLIFAAGLVLAGLLNPVFGLADEKTDCCAHLEFALKTLLSQKKV